MGSWRSWRRWWGEGASRGCEAASAFEEEGERGVWGSSRGCATGGGGFAGEAPHPSPLPEERERRGGGATGGRGFVGEGAEGEDVVRGFWGTEGWCEASDLVTRSHLIAALVAACLVGGFP